MGPALAIMAGSDGVEESTSLVVGSSGGRLDNVVLMLACSCLNEGDSSCQPLSRALKMLTLNEIVVGVQSGSRPVHLGHKRTSVEAHDSRGRRD